MRPWVVPAESVFALPTGMGFCDDEEEDELILDDGRDDLTDDFCDDNGGFWRLLLFGPDDPDGSRGDVCNVFGWTGCFTVNGYDDDVIGGVIALLYVD